MSETDSSDRKLVIAINVYGGSSLSGLALELESLFFNIPSYISKDSIAQNYKLMLRESFSPLFGIIEANVDSAFITSKNETKVAIMLFLLSLSPNDEYVTNIINGSNTISLSDHVKININHYYEFLYAMDDVDLGNNIFSTYMKKFHSTEYHMENPNTMPELETLIKNRASIIFCSLIGVPTSKYTLEDSLSQVLFDLCPYGLGVTPHIKKGDKIRWLAFRWINEIIQEYKDLPFCKLISDVLSENYKLHSLVVLRQLQLMPFHNIHRRRYEYIDKFYEKWSPNDKALSNESDYTNFSKAAHEMIVKQFHGISTEDKLPKDNVMFILVCDSKDADSTGASVIRCELQKAVFKNFLKVHQFGEVGEKHHILESTKNVRVAISRNFAMQYVYDLYARKILPDGSFLRFLDDDGVNGLSLTNILEFIQNIDDLDIGFYKMTPVAVKFPDVMDHNHKWKIRKESDIPPITKFLRDNNLYSFFVQMMISDAMWGYILNVKYVTEFQHIPAFTQGEDVATWAIIRNRIINNLIDMKPPRDIAAPSGSETIASSLSDIDDVNSGHKFILQYYSPTFSYKTGDSARCARNMFTALYNKKFYNIGPDKRDTFGTTLDFPHILKRSTEYVRELAKQLYRMDGETMTDKVFHEDTILIGLVDDEQYAFFAGNNPIVHDTSTAQARSITIKSLVREFNTTTGDKEGLMLQINKHNEEVEHGSYSKTYGGNSESFVTRFIKLVAVVACIVIIVVYIHYTRNAYKDNNIDNNNDVRKRLINGKSF